MERQPQRCLLFKELSLTKAAQPALACVNAAATLMMKGCVMTMGSGMLTNPDGQVWRMLYGMLGLQPPAEEETPEAPEVIAIEPEAPAHETQARVIEPEGQCPEKEKIPIRNERTDRKDD